MKKDRHELVDATSVILSICSKPRKDYRQIQIVVETEVIDLVIADAIMLPLKLADSGDVREFQR